MKPKVLVTENIHQVGWETLRADAEAVAWGGQEKQPLLEAVKDVQAILVRVAKLTPEVIQAASQLKVIGKHGVGYDNINIPAATARGVVVTNTPLANSTSVAEHALALLLGSGPSDRRIRPGPGPRGDAQPEGLSGAGVVGEGDGDHRPGERRIPAGPDDRAGSRHASTRVRSVQGAVAGGDRALREVEPLLARRILSRSMFRSPRKRRTSSAKRLSQR